MRYFALTAIGSFAIMSATALCAAQVAVSTEATGFSGVSIELARGAQSHDRRGKANDGHTGAAASQQMLARGSERNGHRSKGYDDKTGAAALEQTLARGSERNGHRSKGHDDKTSAAVSSDQLLACGNEAHDDHGKHTGKHGAASSEQVTA